MKAFYHEQGQIYATTWNRAKIEPEKKMLKDTTIAKNTYSTPPTTKAELQRSSCELHYKGALAGP